MDVTFESERDQIGSGHRLQSLELVRGVADAQSDIHVAITAIKCFKIVWSA